MSSEVTPTGSDAHDNADKLERAETNTDSHHEQLRNMLTNTMSVSPEMFERLYLNPKGQVKGDLRKTFANPTPLALLGFSVALLPLSTAFSKSCPPKTPRPQDPKTCRTYDTAVRFSPLTRPTVGWRGAGGFAIATTTASIWFGGLCLVLAGIGEFLLGNTFPFVVFMGYGAHFLTFATTFIPWFNAVGFFGPGAESDPMSGMTAEFAASFGEFPPSHPSVFANSDTMGASRVTERTD